MDHWWSRLLFHIQSRPWSDVPDKTVSKISSESILYRLKRSTNRLRMWYIHQWQMQLKFIKWVKSRRQFLITFKFSLWVKISSITFSRRTTFYYCLILGFLGKMMFKLLIESDKYLYNYNCCCIKWCLNYYLSPMNTCVISSEIVKIQVLIKN